MSDSPRRYSFQDSLEECLGSSNVYFQPPENVKLVFPAIIYNKRNGDYRYADNGSYIRIQGYDVMVISKDPDFVDTLDIPDRFPMCRLDRHFVSDSLNHDVFVIYY